MLGNLVCGFQNIFTTKILKFFGICRIPKISNISSVFFNDKVYQKFLFVGQNGNSGFP